MKRSIKYMAAALVMASALPVTAQELRTSYFMETSNFRHQMNPALLDDSYVSVLMGNINIGLTGNIGAKDFIYKTSELPGFSNPYGYEYTTFMNPEVNAAQFLGGLSDKNRLDTYLNYNLFSVGFKAFGGTNLVELNLRSNTNVTLPKELFEFAKTTGAKEQYDLSGIGVRTQNYMELALGHSHRINPQWKVGGKMKFLIGAAYADFQTENLNVTMNGNQWGIQGKANLKASILESQLTHSGKPDPATNRPKVDGLDDVAFGLPGFGVAFDLGATYKPIEDLTVSLGLTDLGFISWKNTKHASSAGEWTFDGFQNIYAGSGEEEGNKLDDQFESLGDDLEELFSVYDDGEKTATQALAATLNIGAEYTLPAYRKLRFGFLYTSRIQGAYSWHEGMLSANIRPLKWIEASVNTAVSSTGWTVGGAVSLKAPHFNFFLATDRFFGKLSKQGIPLNSTNGNVCFGFTFPL